MWNRCQSNVEAKVPPVETKIRRIDGKVRHHLEILAEQTFKALREWSDQTKKLVEDQFWIGMSETLIASLSLYMFMRHIASWFNVHERWK